MFSVIASGDLSDNATLFAKRENFPQQFEAVIKVTGAKVIKIASTMTPPIL